MFQRMMAVMVLLAASLNAVPAQSAPVAHGADQGGVYLQIEGEGLASPAIPIGNLIQMPRETRRISLTYRPTAEERAEIERVVWDGAVSQGETSEGYTAVLEVEGVGNYEAGLHVSFVAEHDLSGPGQIREVDRTFHLRVEDIAAASVRAVIEYPGTLQTPPVDLDGNFRVDEQDLAKFWEGYGTVRGTAGYASLSDWDGNGAVELEDLVRFFDAYEGWKGREIGPSYGGGLVYPLTVKPNPHGFSVPSPIYSARTEPGGFEAWIEWQVNRVTMGVGPVFSRKFDVPGRHEVSSGVFGAVVEMQDARTLEIYRTRVAAFEGGAPLTDGVTYTFEARTEPPGYEDYVTWFAATLYGTVTPAHGRGRTFSVRFEDTWGPLPEDPSQNFQWLGVQADNAYLNQDQKPRDTTDVFTSTGRATVTFNTADSTCATGIQLSLATALTNSMVRITAPPYVTGQDIPTEVLQLGLETDDPSLGHITVNVRTDQRSLGTIDQVVADGAGHFVSGHSFFDVFVTIHSSALNEDFDTGSIPIHLDAGTITALPPLGSHYMQPPASQSVRLYNEAGSTRTNEAGSTRTWVGWLRDAENAPVQAVCSVTIAGPACFCKDRTVRYTANGNPPGGTYAWTVDPAAKATIVGAANQPTVDVKGVAVSAALHDVTLQVTYTPPGKVACVTTKTINVIEATLSPLGIAGEWNPLNDASRDRTTGNPVLGPSSPDHPPGCTGFFKNMEIKGTITPCVVGLICTYNFKRLKQGRDGVIRDGCFVPGPSDCPAGGCNDDPGADGQDVVLDAEPNCTIFVVDNPGIQTFGILCGNPPGEIKGDIVFNYKNFKEWLEVDGERCTEDKLWYARTRIECDAATNEWGEVGDVSDNDIGEGNPAVPAVPPICQPFLANVNQGVRQFSVEHVGGLLRSEDIVDRYTAYAIVSGIKDVLVDENRTQLIGELTTISAARIEPYESDSPPMLAIQLLGELKAVEAVRVLIERVSEESRSPRMAKDAGNALAAIGGGAVRPILEQVESATESEWRILRRSLLSMEEKAAVREGLREALERRIDSRSMGRLTEILVRFE